MITKVKSCAKVEQIAFYVSPETPKRYSSAHLKPAVGSSRCKCGGCGEAFNSLSAFDLHQSIRNGVLKCTHPLDLVDKNGNPKPLMVNAAGWWVTALNDREF